MFRVAKEGFLEKVDSVARWGQNLCDCLKLLRSSTGRTGCESWCCPHTQGIPVNSWLQHFSHEDSSGWAVGDKGFWTILEGTVFVFLVLFLVFSIKPR